MPRVGRATLCLLALGLIELAVALLVAHSYFLAVNLVYTQLLLLVPSFGVLLLLVSRTRTVTRAVRTLAWTSLILVPVFVDATFIEPFRLVTEATTIPIARERALPQPLVIGVLADLQCVVVTDREREAVARVMAVKPDMIVLPGDLQQVGFDHRDEIAAQFRELFAPLSAPLGVWYVEGNTESTAEARHLLAGTPVKILDDEIVHLVHAGARIALCGVDLNYSPRASAALNELLDPADVDDVRIVLAHRPDVVYAIAPRTRVDLVVAGHTHGGQVQVPFFGPPITLSSVPCEVAAGGLHAVDGVRVYVSRGIGWEHGHAPRVRFNCTPEVSVLTLQRAP